MTGVSKIECQSCGYINAEIRLVLTDGIITIDKNGVVTYSDEPRVRIGDTLESFLHQIKVIDYLGECPKCEDEAFIVVHFKDGTHISDPRKAVKKM